MCNNTKSKEYPKYGGNGVKVDNDWSSKNPNGSANFIDWLDDQLRERPQLLEKDYLVVRKEFSGDFSPDNCTVVTREEVRELLRKDKKK